MKANVYLVSPSYDRVVALDGDTAQYEIVEEFADNERPLSIASVPNGKFLLAMPNRNEVIIMDADGNELGVFANISPAYVKYLPAHNKVAVIHSDSERKIYFFDVAETRFEQIDQFEPLTIDDAREMRVNVTEGHNGNSDNFRAIYLLEGENDNEILVISDLTSMTSIIGKELVRQCLPWVANTVCNQNDRNKVMIGNSAGYELKSVGVMRSKETYLLATDENAVSQTVYECDLTRVWADQDQFYDECTVFARDPEGHPWYPQSILVDDDKEIVYISDRENAIVYVFTINALYLGRLESETGFLVNPEAMAIKTGPFAPLSTFISTNPATAGMPQEIPITLTDDDNRPISESYPIIDDLSRFKVTASATINGLATTTAGSVIHNATAPAHSSLTAILPISAAGNWTVSITEGKSVPQHLLGSPYEVVVEPAPTDPAACEIGSSSTITAGEEFDTRIQSFDSFFNPTFHSGDKFSYVIDDNGSEFQIIRSAPKSNTFSMATTLTKAGIHSLSIYHQHQTTATEIQGSPFFLQVNPAPPSAAHSKHTVNGAEDKEISIKSGPAASSLLLKVSPFDKFNNPLTNALGYENLYAVTVEGLSAEFDGTYALKSGNFSLSESIPLAENLVATITLIFTYNDTFIGDGAPVKVFVSPPRTNIMHTVRLVAAVLVPISILFCSIYCRHQRKARLQVEQLELEQAEQRQLFQAKEEVLRHENENLHESLRRKKHNEDELLVMAKAMQDLTKERSDELKEVLISSKEVEVSKLLGKGGFGVVNLANYRGQPVAMKQLLTINSESVKRFRFECFLMKKLRHPNIVKLIGVVWDEDMFACCLEFISNGSLEDHLRKSVGKNHKMLNWKEHLLKTATECALGVQYLHQERYWFEGGGEKDEDGNVLEPGWRECIIHRDLKPDNMLLTADWMLKLTDFGEARATDLNHTMTSVGTPIYVAPEVMKNERYDFHADTYSFSICLVAMIRAEKNVIDFFFEALRKTMKRKTKKGVGITMLNNRMYSKGWRPLLPRAFQKAFPKLSQLIRDCWRQKSDDRPNFDGIVRRLQGEISDEVKRKEEPVVIVMSKEDDNLYIEQMKLEAEGGEGVFEDDDEEEEDVDMVTNRMKTLRESVRNEMKVELEARDRMLEELTTRFDTERRGLVERNERLEALLKEGGVESF
jgi:serine/threonine protein kinase/DNA-binding beta-propeller fold protein YncE